MISFCEDDFNLYSKQIFLTDSPTGCTGRLTTIVAESVRQLGYTCKVHNKGTIEVLVPGLDHSKTVATSAHIDTLGLMVRSIKPNGTLAVTKIGGPLIPTLDGEYCKVMTRDGRILTGTILSTSPAAHVYPDASSKLRDEQNIEIRLDEEIRSKEDAEKFGITNGAFVFIDPKFTVTPSGFLKSRFIDDKASAVILLMLLSYCKKNDIKFKYDTRIYFVVYEEVGHGASAVFKGISEFVTLDMGCIGEDLAGNEYSVSICAKDSGGPYDYELTNRLIETAKDLSIPYTVDIFPFYGSDIGAALRAGVDVKGALIGTGVHASHGMERTHMKGIEATLKLIYAYLCE